MTVPVHIFDPVLGDRVLAIDDIAALATAAGQALIYFKAGAPTNGTSGTFAGSAVKGSLLVDVTNATLYQNTNTLASPTWTQLTAVGGSGAYSGTFDGTVGGTTPAAVTATTIAGTTGSFSDELSLSRHDALTALAGGGRAGATALDKQFNRISVCATAADSAVLPAGVAGDWRLVINDGAAAAQIFANGSNTIDGVAGATGIVLPAGYRALFFCLATGVWQTLSGSLSNGLTEASASGAVSAAGTSSQANATALTADFNRVGTVAANAGVALPQALPGRRVIILNAGANTLKIWPINGGSDAIDALSANANTTLSTANRIASFYCFQAGTWISSLGGAVAS
jgi:hypothetical protein